MGPKWSTRSVLSQSSTPRPSRSDGISREISSESISPKKSTDQTIGSALRRHLRIRSRRDHEDCDSDDHAKQPLSWTRDCSSASFSDREKHSHGTPGDGGSRLTRLACNTWFFEILAMGFSLACILAIVTVLLMFHRRARPALPFGLTLNAIVSTLATGAKTSLVCVIAAAISQLKWCWFRQRHKLNDLQTFDDASRGPAGSFNMLLERTGNVLTSVAASATILALFFDPFVQQVLQYATVPVVARNETAVTRVANGFPVAPAGLGLMGAMNSGLWAESSQFSPTAQCPSGNCQWSKSFESLAWCSKCTDATAEATLSPGCNVILQQPNVTCQLSLGNGLSVQVAEFSIPSGDVFNSQDLGNGNLTLATDVLWPTYSINMSLLGVKGPYPPGYVASGFLQKPTVLDVQAPAMAFGYARLSNDLNSNSSYLQRTLNARVTKAEQCVLTPCLQSYAFRTTNGVSTSIPVTTNYGYTKFPRVKTALQGICWQPSTQNISYTSLGAFECDDMFSCTLFSNPSHNSFCLLDAYADKISSYLQGTTIANPFVDGDSWYMSPYPVNSNDIVRRVAASNLSYVVDNVAKALTNYALEVSNHTVRGTVLVSEVQVQIKWCWLILPSLLELTTLCILCATMRKTRKDGIALWRSSLLPLIYHVSDDENGDACGMAASTAFDVAGMQEMAEKTHMRLYRSAVADWSLLRHVRSPRSSLTESL